jgi:hypothetical protein
MADVDLELKEKEKMTLFFLFGGEGGLGGSLVRNASLLVRFIATGVVALPYKPNK